MGPEQEWIDAAVYGLPWRVHSEFAEEQLSAVAMAHYRGLARERPFKRYEGFDNALLALSAEELFAELASRIAAAYGPPSEIDGLQRWAWNTACVRIALERGTPQALADVYLWLRPGGG
jgi:hypothetical protein